VLSSPEAVEKTGAGLTRRDSATLFSLALPEQAAVALGKTAVYDCIHRPGLKAFVRASVSAIEHAILGHVWPFLSRSQSHCRLAEAVDKMRAAFMPASLLRDQMREDPLCQFAA